MTGMKNSNTGKIEDSTGMIKQETGMIDDSTGMLEENTGLITEKNHDEETTTGRRKRSRERGKDAKPRDFPLHTLKNLPQFRDKSHEEVRRYILEKKGVDIGSSFNFGKTMLWLFVIFAIAIGGIGIAKWLHHRQERKFNVNT